MTLLEMIFLVVLVFAAGLAIAVISVALQPLITKTPLPDERSKSVSVVVQAMVGTVQAFVGAGIAIVADMPLCK